MQRGGRIDDDVGLDSIEARAAQLLLLELLLVLVFAALAESDSKPREVAATAFIFFG